MIHENTGHWNQAELNASKYFIWTLLIKVIKYKLIGINKAKHELHSLFYNLSTGLSQ